MLQRAAGLALPGVAVVQAAPIALGLGVGLRRALAAPGTGLPAGSVVASAAAPAASLPGARRPVLAAGEVGSPWRPDRVAGGVTRIVGGTRLRGPRAFHSEALARADAAGCLTLPTAAQATAFLAAEMARRAPGKVTAAERNAMAAADVASGGARNGSSYGARWILFLPGNPSKWRKKVWVWDETGDFVIGATDPGADPAKAGGSTPQEVGVRNAIRVRCADRAGDLSDLDRMVANKPGAGESDDGWTSTRNAVLGNIHRVVCELSTILASYESSLPAGAWKTAVLTCYAKGKRALTNACISVGGKH